MKNSTLGIVFLIALSGAAQAGSMNDHRNLAFRASMDSLAQRLPAPWFVSFVSSNHGDREITSPDGSVLMLKRGVISSVYDPTSSYEIGRFFEAKDQRLSFILNWGVAPGTLLSFGVDTGYRAEKLRVKPAIYLGSSHTWAASKDSSVFVGFGTWLGGRVTETPCFDSYDRAYSCTNLVAWTDRDNLNGGSFSSLDLRYTYYFD